MSGKRLLDAAALFNASRAIASQHLSIRLRQLNVYNKTSTFAKALKRRTDPAAQATSSSALRSSPSPNGASSRQTYSSKSGATAVERIPSPGSVQDRNGKSDSTEGLEQDHHYRPQDNSVVDDVPDEELQVQQEKANRHPLPDGTIPTGEAALGRAETDRDVFNHWSASEPAKKPSERHEAPPKTLEPKSSGSSTIPDPDAMSSERSALSSGNAKVLQRQSEFQIPSKAAEPPGEEAYEVRGSLGEKGHKSGADQGGDTFYQAPDSASPVVSSLPRVKLPKNAGDVQGGDPHIKENVNADVFYTSADSGDPGPPKEPEEPSEEMVNQIFHSPRVARILGSKQQFGSLKPKNAGSSRRKSTIAGGRKNRDDINTRTEPESVAQSFSGGQSKPAPGPSRERDDITKLAADIEKDVRVSSTVCNTSIRFCTMLIN
jgi:aarF domain-containing kinase